MSQRFGRKAALNAALLSTVASMASYAGGMVTSILVARALGPTDYGQYAYVVWLAGLMVTLASSGFSSSAMRFISEYVGRGEAAVSYAVHHRLRRQALLAVAAACLLLLLGWHWVRPQEVGSTSPVLLCIALVAFGSKSWFMFESAAAKGYGRFWVEPACLASLSVVNVAGVVVLWYLQSKLQWYLGWFAVLSVAHLVLVFALTRGESPGANGGALDESLRMRVGQHLRWGMVLAGVTVLASRSFETFLLNAHGGAQEVAFFSIAVMLTRSGVDLLAGGLSSVMVPVMSHAFGAGGNERLRKVFVDATRYYLFVGLTLAGLGWFWAEPAIILMYGERYRAVVQVLQVLVVGASLMMPSGGLTALLSSTENQRLRVWFMALSLLISATLAFTLVPRWGLQGALVSVTTSQWIVYIVTIAMVDRWLGFRLPYGALARQAGLAVLGVVVAAGAAFLVQGLGGQVTAGFVFLLVFVSGSWFAGVWSAAEREMVRGYLARLPVLRRAG